MAFPDQLLAEGERLLVHERPHSKMLVPPAAVFLLVCGVGGYLAARVRPASWWGVGWSVLAVISLAVVCWFSVLPSLRWINTHFVVTNRRVLVREGVLSRIGFEIPMSRIGSVHFRQGAFERMLGCGTLSIESVSGADAEQVEFDKIPRVELVYRVLRDAIG